MTKDNERQLVHTRQITCRAFRLKNGFLEIEATVSDEKGQEVAFRSRPPVQVGEYMHRMSLTLTIDGDDSIQDVRASTQIAPWAMCGGTDDAYRKLIGLRIGPGFSQQVKMLLGGVEGCTHVTELVAQAANIYMQASWPDRIARQMAVASDPRQWPDKSTLGFVDHCHAWRRDGETILQEYPELAPPEK
ncbi:DUF2889 domain-containing protein [Sulfuritalea sp.]|uniref:DUF2889 domain-containing protein n=1 Tax=Sulfuritalea sp. TaxID=2480090 RepID=UPI00286E1502|nr:DUF2889 domain-containing protein [Sulfuritalea sp.]